MAVELATAYVSVVPTTKGIEGALAKELSPLTGAAAKAGTDSGKALGSSFTGASGGLKSSVDQAGGHLDNFKSKATGALSSVGISSQALALGGGAAIIGFGLKAVGAFTDTAKAALDLGTSTGLAVEEASRWIAVGDDYEVSAGALATGLGKVSKTLDDTKWAKYGIDTRDAAGQARSANDILLDSFDTLSGITNETERARVGQELFGKGYQSLTPILGHTRAEYEKMLGSVEKGQVITAREAERAEAWRLAMDNLRDAFNDVVISIGGMIAQAAPLLNFFASAITKATELNDALGKIPGTTSGKGNSFFGSAIESSKFLWDEFTDSLHENLVDFGLVTDEAKTKTDALATSLDDGAVSAGGFNDTLAASANAAAAVKAGIDDASAATDAYKRHSQMMADDVKRGLDQISGRWDALEANIANETTWINLQMSFDDVIAKMVEAGDTGGKSAGEIERGYQDARLAVLDQKAATEEYAKEVLGLPPERVTRMLADIDAGSLAEVEAELANLTRNRTANIQIVSRGGAGYSDDRTFASGGWTPGGRVLLGEKGAEFVDLPMSSYVHPAAETRAMMSTARWETIDATSIIAPVVNNYGREFGIADMNHVLAMARLAS